MKPKDNFGSGLASQLLDSDLVKNVDRILELIASGQRLITMAGPAGCGKTERIAQVIRAYKGRVCVVACMEQAVRMLQRRDIAATTIHSLIYTPRGKKHQRPKRESPCDSHWAETALAGCQGEDRFPVRKPRKSKTGPLERLDSLDGSSDPRCRMHIEAGLNLFKQWVLTRLYKQ